MISAPKMEAPQQWQSFQPIACAQPQMAIGVEGQLYQPTICAPQPMTPAVEVWMCGTSAMAQQHPNPVLMVPVTPYPNIPANGFPVNDVSSTMMAPCQPTVVAGYEYNADATAAGLPLQAFVVGEGPAGVILNSDPESHRWQPVPSAPPAEFVILMPVRSVDTVSWDPVPPCTTVNFGEFVSAAAPQATVAPQTLGPLMPFASNCISLDLAIAEQGSSTGMGAHKKIPEPENTRCEHLAVNILPEAVQPGLLHHKAADLGQHVECAKEFSLEQANYYVDCTREPLLDWESSVDDLSECGIPGDEFLDINANARDAKSYASSDTSTSVSRSARRRRGRRAAKAKACKASLVIVETPVPEDLLVTEEKKVELIGELEAGGDVMRRAVSSLRGSVLRLSLEPFGCRVVQTALDVASAVEKEGLVSELHNHVRLAISSPHANFVIQKVIEVLPINSASFVAEELATFAAEVARHRFGCRVLSRLVEHHLCGNSSAPSTNVLIDEVLRETDQLIHHNFARHVLELILEHGTKVQKHKIAEAIRSNLFHYAKNRFASYVVEKALSLCEAADRHAMVSELLSEPERFLALAVHECGTHVAKAVMTSHADCTHKAKKLLVTEVSRVKSSKYGKRLLDEL